MLQVNNLSKSYGDKVLFKDVSFSVNAGDKIGLIGTNGSGKSTLLQCIVSLVLCGTNDTVQNGTA